MQDSSNSSVLAIELLQSCTKPSTYPTWAKFGAMSTDSHFISIYLTLHVYGFTRPQWVNSYLTSRANACEFHMISCDSNESLSWPSGPKLKQICLSWQSSSLWTWYSSISGWLLLVGHSSLFYWSNMKDTWSHPDLIYLTLLQLFNVLFFFFCQLQNYEKEKNQEHIRIRIRHYLKNFSSQWMLIQLFHL